MVASYAEEVHNRRRKAMNQPVRLGVWGCGGHAVNHLEHMPSPELIKVTALTDLDVGRMDKARGIIGGKDGMVTSTDPRNIFDAVDAVFIATPDHCHAEQIEMALHAGKHVLAEKPLAVDQFQLAQLEANMNYAAGHGLHFSTCHPRRFDPRNIWTRDNLDVLILRHGSPVGFTFTFDYPAPKDVWKNTRGLLMDHVNHEIDLLGFFLEPDDFTARRLKDSAHAYEVIGCREGDDVWFRFAGTRSNAVKYWSSSRETATLYFERGYVEISGGEPMVREFTVDGRQVEEHAVALTHHFTRYGEVVANFASVIRGEAMPYVSLDEMFLNTRTGVDLTHDGCTPSMF